MATGWHNFFFGAFDPAGTISADKLPGAFWVQALFVRVLGMHNWVVVLPQVLEGALTVLVLGRAVRRLAGWRAGLLAAGILALSPAATALDRGNMPDTLMTLLLVLAADAVSKALVSRRWGPVLWAGLWVGLAFQAKMAEAWLAVPALALTALVAGPGPLRRRLGRLSAAGGILLLVSLSWMTVVSTTPAQDRPYVDGSSHDSVFEQVFVYNATARLSGSSATAVQQGAAATTNPPRWDRLLTGSDGLETGWLVPAALGVGAGGLVLRRRRNRTDPVRAALLLWGTWLLVFGAVFSSGTAIITYYAGAIAPAIAALCGLGLAAAWETRTDRRTQTLLLATATVTVGYGVALLPHQGTGLPTSLHLLIDTLAIAATSLAATSLVVSASGVRARGLLGGGGIVAVAAAAALAIPTAATVTVAGHDLGPFDHPFQPAANTQATELLSRIPSLIGAQLPKLEAARGRGFLLATDGSVLASPFIALTGAEVYPIGGATGEGPRPTLSGLEALVAAGTIHVVLAGPSTDPRIQWVRKHCVTVPIDLSGVGATSGSTAAAVHSVTASYCVPASAGG
jgi:4-amino-4-deoxy-L-arabinose transferase-like glycosyltransferase